MKTNFKKILGFITFTLGLVAGIWFGYVLIEKDKLLPVPAVVAVAFLTKGWKSMFIINDAKADDAAPTKQPYEDMRMLWLNMPQEGASLDYIGSAEAYMVGMEFTISHSSQEVKRIIVLAGAKGDASVYFQSNNAQGLGGFLGGGATHENIAKDAISMVQIASANVPLMQPTVDFPLTSAEHVRFIVGTKNGRYTIEMDETEAQKKDSPWYNLYSAGQQIITDYRLVNK